MVDGGWFNSCGRSYRQHVVAERTGCIVDGSAANERHLAQGLDEQRLVGRNHSADGYWQQVGCQGVDDCTFGHGRLEGQLHNVAAVDGAGIGGCGGRERRGRAERAPALIDD